MTITEIDRRRDCYVDIYFIVPLEPGTSSDRKGPGVVVGRQRSILRKLDVRHEFPLVEVGLPRRRPRREVDAPWRLPFAYDRSAKIFQPLVEGQPCVSLVDVELRHEECGLEAVDLHVIEMRGCGRKQISARAAGEGRPRRSRVVNALLRDPDIPARCKAGRVVYGDRSAADR